MKQKVNNEQIRKSWTVTNTVSIVNTNPTRNSSLPVKNPERQWVLLVVKPKTRPWRCWMMTALLSLRRRRVARRSALTLERRSSQTQRRRRARGASPVISDFHDFLLSKDQPSHFQVRPRLLQHQAWAHCLLLPLWQVGFRGLVKRTTMMIDIRMFCTLPTLIIMMMKMLKTTSRMFCPSHTPAEEHDCDYDYQVSDGKSHKCTDDCNDKRWWWWLTTIIAMITMITMYKNNNLDLF